MPETFFSGAGAFLGEKTGSPSRGSLCRGEIGSGIESHFAQGKGITKIISMNTFAHELDFHL